MSSILIQYAIASPVPGESDGTSFSVRSSIPKGGSASAAAAASDDATLGMLKVGSRCSFFEGGGECDDVRLTMMYKMKESETNRFIDSVSVVVPTLAVVVDVMPLIHMASLRSTHHGTITSSKLPSCNACLDN
jgi:hypothetical protein